MKSPNYLKVSLHGMNNQMQKMMTQYLESYCKKIAVVVNEGESQAEIVDIDLAESKFLLSERLAQVPQKPVIALSVQDVLSDNVIYVKKPIDKPSIINAIDKIIQNNKKQSRKNHYINLYNKTPSKNEVKLSEDDLEPEIKQTTPSPEPISIEIKKEVSTQLKKSSIKPTKPSLLEVTDKKESPNSESASQTKKSKVSSPTLNLATEKSKIIAEKTVDHSLSSTLKVSTTPSEVPVLQEKPLSLAPKVQLSENRKKTDPTENSVQTKKSKVSSSTLNLATKKAQIIVEKPANHSLSSTLKASATPSEVSTLQQKPLSQAPKVQLPENRKTTDPTENSVQTKKSKVSSPTLNLASEKAQIIIEKPANHSLSSTLKVSATPSEVPTLREKSIPLAPKVHLSENRKKTAPEEKSRKAIRYTFQPIKAKLEKKSLIGLSNSFSTLILNISSKGAIIKLKNSSKMQGKLTLTIHFDPKHTFIIPSKVVRKEKKNTYALQFMDTQHELTDFLVESGQTFLF